MTDFYPTEVQTLVTVIQLCCNTRIRKSALTNCSATALFGWGSFQGFFLQTDVSASDFLKSWTIYFAARPSPRRKNPAHKCCSDLTQSPAVTVVQLLPQAKKQSNSVHFSLALGTFSNLKTRVDSEEWGHTGMGKREESPTGS